MLRNLPVSVPYSVCSTTVPAIFLIIKFPKSRIEPGMDLGILCPSIDNISRFFFPQSNVTGTPPNVRPIRFYGDTPFRHIKNSDRFSHVCCRLYSRMNSCSYSLLFILIIFQSFFNFAIRFRRTRK